MVDEAGALERAGPDADRFMAALMGLSRQGDPSARWRLMWILRDPGADKRRRRQAVAHFAKISDERAIPALFDIIEQERDEEMARYAVDALGGFRYVEVIDFLIALLERGYPAPRPAAILKALTGQDLGYDVAQWMRFRQTIPRRPRRPEDHER